MAEIICPHCGEGLQPGIIARVGVHISINPERMVGSYDLDWNLLEYLEVYCEECGGEIQGELRDQVVQLEREIEHWYEGGW